MTQLERDVTKHAVRLRTLKKLSETWKHAQAGNYYTQDEIEKLIEERTKPHQPTTKPKKR